MSKMSVRSGEDRVTAKHPELYSVILMQKLHANTFGDGSLPFNVIIQTPTDHNNHLKYYVK